MQSYWELLSNVKRLDLPQQCVSTVYVSAMFLGRVYHNKVLTLGIAQQCNKAACTSAMK